jgi:hypothetical protein
MTINNDKVHKALTLLIVAALAIALIGSVLMTIFSEYLSRFETWSWPL